jgi:hypothetical protein
MLIYVALAPTGGVHGHTADVVLSLLRLRNLLSQQAGILKTHSGALS